MAPDPREVTAQHGRDDAPPRPSSTPAWAGPLLPALRFAARDGFAHVSRLAGVEDLVEGVLTRAGAGVVGDAVARALRDSAAGFDRLSESLKRARVQRMLDVLSTLSASQPAAAPSSKGDAVVPAPTPPTAALASATAASATATMTVAAGTQTTATRNTAPRTTATRPARPPASVTAPSTPTDAWSWPVARLKGIGPTRAAQLAARNLMTLGDVLSTLPRTYEDRRTCRRIGELEDGLLAVVSGTVQVAGVVGGGRGRRFEAVLDDGSGQLRLVFFHFRAGELERRLARGAVITVAGEVKKQGGRATVVHPRVHDGDAAQALGGVKPIYPELQGLHPLELARVAALAVDAVKARGLPDPLPTTLLGRTGLVPLAEALTGIHAPPDDVDEEGLRALIERRSPGHQRLAFEELFVLGTALSLRRRAQGTDPAPPLRGTDGEADAVARLLPFSLTGAQRRASGEILADLERPVPMARLLQGDVGAGKTAVAAVAALRSARAGHQTAFMAPTEILAEQHGRTLKKIGLAAGLRVEVLTGSLGKKARTLLESRIANRDVDVIVGTQALLSEGVRFCRVGLCVVDEQHRFGVVQRALLRKKGPLVTGNDGATTQLTPHLLVMTATPIPRSLTLTVYGDLAVSVLDELPPGRTPVATRVVADLGAAVEAMRQTLARDERVFVVFPLIEESEKLDVQAATAGFEDLRHSFGDDVVLLHGRMGAADKDAAMAAFSRGDRRILVSTTVVEVGVDVPQATLMVVVNAERFGLAQLHQLRGRVGRSSRPSTCLLVGGDAGQDALERLRTLEETNDGFRIAEKDLELRGPGDVLGTRQSGVPTLAFSDLVRHAALIERARRFADEIVERDPTLTLPEHADLRRLVLERYAERLALTAAG
ncbi:MAG: ATP-dependent DNA helicase RecG [Deltaproteobacteria bacterium]|nr:ATP-dependent DNA helicase RecG [Deltaproteobacteria bacterium]